MAQAVLRRPPAGRDGFVLSCPVPRRGKRNEPGYVAYTARRLAELRGMEDAAFAEMTTRNFSRLFSQAV
ncbi:TatD family hydrolase [Komagataeibacter rhaeticus]|nr:TatD family hydrolase [Komagataeibacter rhaeticus]